MRLKTTRHGIELCPTLPGQRTLTEQVRGIDVTLYEIESEIAYDWNDLRSSIESQINGLARAKANLDRNVTMPEAEVGNLLMKNNLSLHMRARA